MQHGIFEPIEEGDVVHHPDRIRWTEESFLDVPRKEDNAPSQFLGVFKGGARISVFFFCVMGVLTFFLLRVFYLQIVQGKSYASFSERNRIRITTLRATRGLIVDSRDRLLVTNRPEFLLTVTPAEFPRDAVAKRKLFDHVAEILRESSLTIAEEVSAIPRDPFIRRQALPFRERIDYVDALRLLAAENDLPGFRVAVRDERSYPDRYTVGDATFPMPESIAHVIGYLGKISIDELPARQQQGYLATDLVGRDGVERSYESLLHGKHGKKFIEIDALGQEKSVLREETAQTGSRLTLSIDLDLQRMLEGALKKYIATLPKRERQGAVGIALDPRNGQIRALVTLPTYAPQLFVGKNSLDISRLLIDPAQPLFSRGIAGVYPSGSTIKPVMALAALEEGVITPTTTVFSQGGIAVGPWFFPDWKTGGHGITDVRKAIAESVNTFFYTIGGGYGAIRGLGVERIATWLGKFHFGETLGIDLPSEARGLVPTPSWKQEKRGEPWYIGDTYHLAIGQGDILVTPLQIAAMTSVFANGGTLWQPTVLANTAPRTLESFAAASPNITVVREGMRRTVTEGSARLLATLPVAAAGKTGTAEWSNTRPPHAWFTGFAPYDNPELVLTVLVEEGGEGSSIAVPVVYDVLREYFNKISHSPN